MQPAKGERRPSSKCWPSIGVLGIFGDAASPLLQGLGHPRKTVVVGALQTILVLASVHALAARYGAIGAASAWIPAVATSQLLSGYYVLRLVPSPFSGLARPIAAVVLASGVVGILSALLSTALPSTVGSILAAALSASAAVWILWTLDRRFDLGFARGIAKIFPGTRALFR